jgi:hypothetical protein
MRTLIFVLAHYALHFLLLLLVSRRTIRERGRLCHSQKMHQAKKCIRFGSPFFGFLTRMINLQANPSNKPERERFYALAVNVCQIMQKSKSPQV